MENHLLNLDSIHAQCLIFDTFEKGKVTKGVVMPDMWQHFSDGTLAYKFSGSPNHYSWPREGVAKMGSEWREKQLPVPEGLAHPIGIHLKVVELVTDDGLDPFDRVIHDLGADEQLFFWNERKVCVIVERGQDPVETIEAQLAALSN